MPETGTAPVRSNRLLEVARYFLHLGATGFGGPVALCGQMERDLVEQRGWLDATQMRNVIAVCQTMPGPLAVQVAIYIGYMRCGFRGAWVAGWSLILPASVAVALLAATYVQLHGLPWLAAILYGVKPVVVALILHSWWRLVRLGVDDRFQYGVGLICGIATMAQPGLVTALFIGAGFLGASWFGWRTRQDNAKKLLDAAPLLLLAKLAWFFLVTGAFTFGGGLAVVPLLEKGLVHKGHWLTADDFLMAIAAGMVTPGPVMTAAMFAGYLVAGPLGAVICTVAIYLPSFLLVQFAAPVLMRFRDQPVVKGFIKGVYAAAMGAILGATTILATQAIGDWITAAIAVVGFIGLLRLNMSGPLLVGAASVTGLIASLFHYP